MSFCSGLGLEGAAIYLFTGGWYGDVGLNITAVRDARARSTKMENKKGECRSGNTLTNVTDMLLKRILKKNRGRQTLMFHPPHPEEGASTFAL
jgi:hypothetical protein